MERAIGSAAAALFAAWSSAISLVEKRFLSARRLQSYSQRAEKRDKSYEGKTHGVLLLKCAPGKRGAAASCSCPRERINRNASGFAALAF
jgi:hypothetical protein